MQYLLPFLCSGLGRTTGARASPLRTLRSLLIHGNTRKKGVVIGLSFLTSGRHFESTLNWVVDEEGFGKDC